MFGRVVAGFFCRMSFNTSTWVSDKRLFLPVRGAASVDPVALNLFRTDLTVPSSILSMRPISVLVFPLAECQQTRRRTPGDVMLYTVSYYGIAQVANTQSVAHRERLE